MTLSEAKRIAKDMTGYDVPIRHRNVWIFLDDENGDLIITKDGAPVDRAGVFRNDPKTDEFVDVYSGDVVPFEDVFGKAFFVDKPSLLLDNMTAGIADLGEKIDVLLNQTKGLLQKTNTPPTAMIMVGDLIGAKDDTSYRRLVVLNNYLSSCNTNISMEDFAYLHHDLYTME